MFTATKWNTAEDKEKFVKHFQRFVEKGFPENLFHKEFYKRMSIMNGHIAHYDQSGFYNAQFSTSERRVDFLRQWVNSHANGNPEYTWSDVEKALSIWIQENPQHEARERSDHTCLIEHIERAELARLTAKYA